MQNFKQFLKALDEDRDIHQTIRNLRTLAARAGTPEEGRTARATADRLAAKHGEPPPTSRPSGHFIPREWTKENRSAPDAHPYHTVLANHGFTIDPEQSTEHGRTYRKGSGKNARRVTVDHSPYRSYRWTHRGVDGRGISRIWIGSGEGSAKTLDDHLTRTAGH